MPDLEEAQQEICTTPPLPPQGFAQPFPDSVQTMSLQGVLNEVNAIIRLRNFPSRAVRPVRFGHLILIITIYSFNFWVIAFYWKGGFYLTLTQGFTSVSFKRIWQKEVLLFLFILLLRRLNTFIFFINCKRDLLVCFLVKTRGFSLLGLLFKTLFSTKAFYFWPCG